MRFRLVAVIPAREGSTRIHKKNIADFCGMPLISWTIKAAQEAQIFDRILVSTDSEEIASVANSYGVEVPFLRRDAYDHYSPVSVATITALQQLEETLNETYDIVIQLLPTCPLRTAQHIHDAYQYFLKHQHSFLISCSSYGMFNPWWSVRLNDDGQPERIFPEAYQSRSQDLEHLYCPSGAIWIARTEKLLSEGTFYGESHVYYPLEWRAAIDIDDSTELKIAELIGRG